MVVAAKTEWIVNARSTDSFCAFLFPLHLRLITDMWWFVLELIKFSERWYEACGKGHNFFIGASGVCCGIINTFPVAADQIFDGWLRNWQRWLLGFVSAGVNFHLWLLGVWLAFGFGRTNFSRSFSSPPSAREHSMFHIVFCGSWRYGW